MRSKFSITSTIVGLLLACSSERESTSSSQFNGIVKLYFTDSFHLNDSTANLASSIRYELRQEAGFINSGSFEIPVGSSMGTIHELNIDPMPAGDCEIDFAVERPFIILDRKDNTGDARFRESQLIEIPANYFVQANPVDIWAYRLNVLVVYFDQNISEIEADNIIDSVGAEALTRSRSMFDNAWFYRISTEAIGLESEIKDQVEGLPGVRAVYFDIFGHSYF